MDKNPNLHDVSSTPQFQDLLSKDLNRVSLIYFWAPWAEPCKQMTEVVAELSKMYPAVLFLQACSWRIELVCVTHVGSGGGGGTIGNCGKL